MTRLPVKEGVCSYKHVWHAFVKQIQLSTEFPQDVAPKLACSQEKTCTPLRCQHRTVVGSKIQRWTCPWSNAGNVAVSLLGSLWEPLGLAFVFSFAGVSSLSSFAFSFPTEVKNWLLLGLSTLSSPMLLSWRVVPGWCRQEFERQLSLSMLIDLPLPLLFWFPFADETPLPFPLFCTGPGRANLPVPFAVKGSETKGAKSSLFIEVFEVVETNAAAAFAEEERGFRCFVFGCCCAKTILLSIASLRKSTGAFWDRAVNSLSFLELWFCLKFLLCLQEGSSPVYCASVYHSGFCR